MLLPSLPRAWYDDEDTAGEAIAEPEAQEIDVDTLSAEEQDRLLENWDSDNLEVETTEDSNEEPAEAENSEEESEKPAEETEEEPVVETENSEESELIAGKFKTQEDLIKSYQHAESENSRMAQKIRELESAKPENGEVQKTEPKTEEPQEEKTQTVEERDPFELSENEQEKYNEIEYEKGTAAAQAYLLRTVESHKAEIQAEKDQQAQVAAREAQAKEAANYNDKLAYDYFKILAYEQAKGREDVAAEVLDALADPKSMIDQDLAIKALGQKGFEALRDEVSEIMGHVQRFQPGKDGKYSLQDYKDAYYLKNRDKHENDIRRKASLDTVEKIKKSEPHAKIVTPTKTSHAGVKPKFTSNMTPAEAERQADYLSEEELDAAINEYK